MTLCYLGLGSNLHSPRRQLAKARAHLRKIPRSTIVDASTLYFNPPYGLRAQPPYFNQVIALKTSLSPLKLLHHCHRIEDKQKRVRKIRWGTRTIDIDILFYGRHQLKTHRLTIPHPGIQYRDFVLVPLNELLIRQSDHKDTTLIYGTTMGLGL